MYRGECGSQGRSCWRRHSCGCCQLSGAVTPPPVDDSLLPEPHPPAPPKRTEQRQQCFISTTPAVRDRVAGTNQLEDVDLAAAWRLSRGAGQTVAVIDTGVARHRLLPHLVPGGDYVFPGDGTDDCDGHGTIVAGIIGAAEDPAGEGDSAVSHPTRRSSRSGSRASSSRLPVNRLLASAMSTRSRWRCGRRPTWVPR